MNPKRGKDKLREELSRETPALLPLIEASCAREEMLSAPPSAHEAPRVRYGRPVLRAALALSMCFVLFVVGLSVGRGLTPEPIAPDPSAVVYLDVNPSVELQLDDEGRVLCCVAGNDDAETILSGLVLEGVELNTAMTAVIGSMYVNGYLTPEKNAILVSVDGRDEAEAQRMMTDLAERMQAVFKRSEMDLSIIAQSLEADEALKERAEASGVSVGKQHLVEKMIEGMEALSEESLSRLSQMSIGELNLLYANRAETELFDGDVVKGRVGGFLAAEEALSSLLEAIRLKSDLLERYETDTRYEEIRCEWRLVYCVEIVLKKDLASYQFKMDCETGEVLERDLNFRLPSLDLFD